MFRMHATHFWLELPVSFVLWYGQVTLVMSLVSMDHDDLELPVPRLDVS